MLNNDKKIRGINNNLNPVRINKDTSFGFGDRIGIATHIHAKLVKKYNMFPIFAQQSAREIQKIRRTPEEVLENAVNGVIKSGYLYEWGADADHITDKEWLEKFLNNNFIDYSMFTIDAFNYINDSHTVENNNCFKDRLEKAKKYIGKSHTFAKYRFTYTDNSIFKIVSRYYGAIAFIIDCYNMIKQKLPGFDFEPAFDEKNIDTSPEEHYYLVSELINENIKFSSIGIKFPGTFEKGIDYIGNIDNFINILKIHKEISDYFSIYKLSLHSADDKLRVIGPFSQILEGRFHIKTSGSTWMEALRTISQCDTSLFKKIIGLALVNARENSKAYFIDLDFKRLQDLLNTKNLEELIEIDQTRQLLHISYGSVLGKYKEEIKECLFANEKRFISNVTDNYERYFSVIYGF